MIYTHTKAIKNPIQGYSEQGKPLLGNTWSCLLSSWSTPWLSQPPSPMDTATAHPSAALEQLRAMPFRHSNSTDTEQARPKQHLSTSWAA